MKDLEKEIENLQKEVTELRNCVRFLEKALQRRLIIPFNNNPETRLRNLLHDILAYADNPLPEDIKREIRLVLKVERGNEQ